MCLIIGGIAYAVTKDANQAEDALKNSFAVATAASCTEAAAGLTGAAVGATSAAATTVSAAAGGIAQATVSGAVGGAAASAFSGTCVATGAGTGAVGSAAVTATEAVMAAGGAAIGEGAMAGMAAAATNPVGWAILGATADHGDDDLNGNISVTWDCWKPVIHDNSKEKSNGCMLKDIFNDKRIKHVKIGMCYDKLGKLVNNDNNNVENLLKQDINKFSKIEFIIENAWNEIFYIRQVILPNLQIAFHAQNE